MVVGCFCAAAGAPALGSTAVSCGSRAPSASGGIVKLMISLLTGGFCGCVAVTAGTCAHPANVRRATKNKSCFTKGSPKCRRRYECVFGRLKRELDMQDANVWQKRKRISRLAARRGQ